MLTQVEAEVGVDGTVVLLKPLRLKKRSRAIVTILNDNNDPIEPEMSAKRDSLREMFGSVSLGAPTGLDNETIDADLAREHGRKE